MPCLCVDGKSTEATTTATFTLQPAERRVLVLSDGGVAALEHNQKKKKKHPGGPPFWSFASVEWTIRRTFLRKPPASIPHPHTHIAENSLRRQCALACALSFFLPSSCLFFLLLPSSSSSFFFCHSALLLF
nr:hypothetical protein [Pandoravirus massiliensis]